MKITLNYEKLSEAYKSIQEKFDEYEELLEPDIKDKQRLSEEIERQKLYIGEKQQAFQAAQESLFAQSFPNLQESYGYLLTKLASNGGCLLCGSIDTAGFDKKMKRLCTEGDCPICDSPPAKQEILPKKSKQSFSPTQLKKDHDLLVKEKANLAALEIQRKELQSKIEGLYQERTRARDKLIGYQNQLEALRAKLPVSSDKIAEQEKKLAAEKKLIDELLQALEVQRSEYSMILEGAKGHISKLVDKITKKFEEYAGEKRR